jgi:trehalose synthase
MLSIVEVGLRRFDDYRSIIDPQLFTQVTNLAHELAGKRVLHISATPSGGGVAKILRSLVPLLNDLGMESVWRVLEAEPEFFQVTKMIHNGLQGEPQEPTLAQWELYQEYNRRLSQHIDPRQWDYIIVHDPQPAALVSYLKGKDHAKWVWRYHGDSQAPNPDFVTHFATYLKPYDGLVFTQPEYVFKGLKPDHLAIIPPAIDPVGIPQLDDGEAKQIVRQFGIDTNRPLVVQVSRFDPWKDPLGVIEAYKIAKQQVPDLQLALVGESAIDDPQGKEIYAKVFEEAYGEPDVYLIASSADDKAVRAFQQTAVVVLQKSLREGFGLTVSEALWAGTPVVGGNVGGIPMQIKDGVSGFLVQSPRQAAAAIVKLATNPDLAIQMGLAGQATVRQDFLLPRLIRDDLEFFTRL